MSLLKRLFVERATHPETRATVPDDEWERETTRAHIGRGMAHARQHDSTTAGNRESQRCAPHANGRRPPDGTASGGRKG